MTRQISLNTPLAPWGSLLCCLFNRMTIAALDLAHRFFRSKFMCPERLIDSKSRLLKELGCLLNDLCRGHDGNRRKAFEVVFVEGQDVRDAINLHSRYNPRIVRGPS